MMPAADFKAFLETPYLRKNPACASAAAQDINEAQELLNGATEKIKLAGADPADATLLAYRSMYSAAKALMHHEGYEVSNFRCLLASLAELFVKTNKLDKNLVDQLVAAQKLIGNAQDHVNAAQAFIAKARQLAA